MRMTVLGILHRFQTVNVFNNKIAIVTGGASGIGKALAHRLGNQGAKVVVADLQHQQAKIVANAICDAGGSATARHLDVTDDTAVRELVGQVVSEEGRLDFMFNNAGIAVLGEFRYLPADDWMRILDVNVKGVFSGTAAAYHVMLRQGHGHIVNTASVAGLVPALGLVAYCGSKHAVVGLSTSLRAEAAPHGIHVSVICPGFVRTPMFESKAVGTPTDESTKAQILKLAMDPDVCAVKALNGVAKNKAIIAVTRHAKILWAIQRYAPRLFQAYCHRTAQKMHNQCPKQPPE